MTVEGLIRVASHGPLKAEDVEQTADALGSTVSDMFDRLARRIAEAGLRQR
jgi:hypothetical protein